MTLIKTWIINRFKKTIKQSATSLIGAVSVFAVSAGYADQDLISIFPLNHYDQTISIWIKPSDADFDKPLLSAQMQQKRLAIFNDHYVGSLSPWNAEYVGRLLQQSAPNDLNTVEQSLIDGFSNEGKPDNQIGYGENFQAYTPDWIKGIANNINIAQFDHLTYQANRRGIAVDNLNARALPTDDVHFYHYKLAGQGYPFDNLQMSALWAGTPVYILGETRDRDWMLVITPDYIGWVKSRGIARADNAFIDQWTKAAKNKWVAITRTQTSLVDDKGNFLLLAYVGSVFPSSNHATDMQIMVPVADAEHHAVIKNATISADQAAFMPVTATPHHFATIMSTLIGRPYGWGSLYFYNDCSAELKSLLTPFGIWVPRHSSDQVTAGNIVDMSAASQDKRLAYLMESSQRFLTLVYIGGHVVMYIGNYANPNKSDSLMAMTYQNIWGLSPNPAVRRAVIGKAVLFPMLLQYPEDASLVSLAGKKYFQVSHLTQLPNMGLLMNERTVNMKSLMYPEARFNE